MNEIKTAQDVIDILKRRKTSILVTAVTIFVIGAATAFLIPPKYRSTSTILIEEQEVPRELVNTTVTSYADQRLQTINQRIMGTDRLLEIITKFNLYPELRKKWTTEEIVAKMRKDIKLNTISADVIDPRSGASRPATIAFTLSYEGKVPQVVQQVSSELASLYLAENLATRERQSQGTTSFLEEELKTVQVKLAEADAKLAQFKTRNVTTLPELVQVNLQVAESAEHELESFQAQLRNLKERESSLKTQLDSISTDAATQDKSRLNELRVRLGELKTRFTDEHPDVIKTKAELADLVKELRATGRETADNKPDNVAYITISSQLSGVRSEIDSVKRQIASYQKKRDEYRGRVASTPGVEEGYRSVMTDRNNLQVKYDDLSRKVLEAKTAHGLEKEQKGERFTLIDAARLPEKPFSPNIPAVLLIGLVLGIGSGIGVAALKEQGDFTVRHPERLAYATSFPVLACIPEIVTWQDHALQKTQRRKRLICFVAVLVLAPVAFHFLVMDLDVFWARLLRRAAKI
ncbi:chain-length determining protein [Geomonas sp. Red875]|uniref:Chain-length determining protein n=2 Tax=Geomesophilobacter sediminis TaxID=2798584 RepID=A0A8J7LUW9_9BACT|nr:chain-length determining protein [Geomesophilobacter sediminis]